MQNKILACCYCGDTMSVPSSEIIERFGEDALYCCGGRMIELDTTNLYRLAKGLEKLRQSIEKEITKDIC